MVLIGVKQAGDLTQLNAVRTGIDEMAVWARSQGIDGVDLRILCDDDGPVLVHQIAAQIRELVDSCAVEQLLVYFSGHGIYNNGERWLLSMAPEDTSQAVNVEASMMLARYCNIPHVVFISDACRDAAAGIQMMQITGSAIFPGGMSNEEMPVDAFFACTRGSVAFEVANVAETGAPYTALFTSVLSTALRGEAPAALDIESAEGKEIGYVRAWKLTDHLREAVPRQLTTMLGAIPRTSQLPGSRITSRNAWLSCVAGPFPAGSGGGWKMRNRRAKVGQSAPQTLAQFVTHLLPLALRDSGAWRRRLEQQHGGTEFEQLKILIALLCSDRGQGHGPRGRLTVRGTRVREVVCRHGSLDIFPGPDTTDVDWSCASPVVVVTECGHGVLVPPLSGRSAELVFKNGALLDLRYFTEGLTAEYPLHATLSAASNMGALYLPDAMHSALPLHLAAFHDPTVLLYLAYAHHDAQATGRQVALDAYRKLMPAAPLFDLQLLAGAGSAVNKPSQALTPIPMISQGWNLLSAFDIALPEPLKGLERHLLPSYWTLFDAEGTDRLTAALMDGDI